MSYGTVTIGRMTLRENFTVSDAVNANTGARAVALTGEESAPPLTLAEVAQRREDLAGLMGRTIPVRFTDKDDYDGWYTVTDMGADVTNWNDEVVKFAWNLKLNRIGPENAIDIESRLTGVGRQNTFSLAGERWHAPAASATGYYTGTSQPSGSVTRSLADGEGTITVYRGVPASVSPRWGTTLANYGRGRARVLVGAVERVPMDLVISASASNWELNNGLMKVTPGASATLNISAWDGSAWDRIDWNASVTASTSGALTSWSGASVLRNDYELVTLRLMAGTSATSGRVMLDLTLRRGARVVETYLQTDVAGTKSRFRAAAEAATAPASASYVTATSNDAGGNKFVAIAATSFTALTTQGGLTKTATRTLDAGLGSVVGGSGAAAGDVATVLRDHYILSVAETTMEVRR
jgi:hypothetical protein